MGEDDLAALAYIYGFPLVFDLENVQRIVDHGLGALPPVPFNTLNHGRALAGADDRFVSINNDTVYSMAQLDLGVGPLLLHVPDSGGRYYLPEFYLVDNPIGRYSLGDRTPGIVPDDDGGITITMSHAEPTVAKARANWLPTPPGRFRPILRMYMPGRAVLDGTYVPAAIRRAP